MKVTLSFKAVEFLRDMLAAPGWNKNDNVATAIKNNYFAGKILAEKLPTVPEVPEDKLPGRNSSPADLKAFQDLSKKLGESKAPELVLEDKEEAVCKVALKWFIQEGKTPSGVAMNELIDSFKLLE
jgi:hypothetical protein